ncbi:hypothetical protein J2Y44_001448 [Dyadobacter sp. BE32]|uniref:Uncharacterized protein n=1 Tax=Dyadobacter fermentans TaxID=94254 RepID=A0ABU1QUR1_9BACT|nr:hypothetical protein [Dyadobacter fermentans]MDR7042154.1 hypothetical protein [Dyadobacter sp. BE242]MDR7212898.1 hypothetical protein [Dyadobacter sp. BE31]MDR7261963.1 hypothetical protein [Dyadobacter sp. BE32]
MSLGDNSIIPPGKAQELNEPEDLPLNDPVLLSGRKARGSGRLRCGQASPCILP